LKYCDKNGIQRVIVNTQNNSFLKVTAPGVHTMKKSFKIMFSCLCMLFIPLSTVHANINDLIYVLYVKAPHAVYVPTFEFESNNSLKVIGASGQYGELSGTWQESDLVAFSFFQAQVEESVTSTTTTTTPETPQNPRTLGRMDSSALQPAESDKTKFLINVAGFAFPPFPLLPSIGWMVGTGAYLGAEVVFIGFTGVSDALAFGSIFPPGALPELTVPCTVTCRNTTFTDGNVEVAFSPDEGLSVESLSVQSDTEVQFNLVIAVDAPLGQKVVTVSYGSPRISVPGSGLFLVTDDPTEIPLPIP